MTTDPLNYCRKRTYALYLLTPAFEYLSAGRRGEVGHTPETRLSSKKMSKWENAELISLTE